MSNRRSESVEVFRCLMMALVVLHHACGGSRFGSSAAEEVLFMPTLMAVDGFLAISGWYGLRFSWRKAGAIYGLFFFYGCCYLGWACVQRLLGVPARLSLGLSGAWFISAYLALMLLSPWINAGLEALLRQGGARGLLRAYLPFLVLMGLNWLPMVSRTFGFAVGGMETHSFGQVLFVYVTMRVLRLSGVAERLSTRQVCWVAAGCAAVFLGLTVALIQVRFGGFGGCHVYRLCEVMGYHALPTVFCAASAMILFTRVRVPAWLGRVACWVGPSLFGIYILHNANTVGRKIWLPKIEEALLAYWPEMPVGAMLLLEAGVCFAGCLGVEALRRGVWVAGGWMGEMGWGWLRARRRD